MVLNLIHKVTIDIVISVKIWFWILKSLLTFECLLYIVLYNRINIKNEELFLIVYMTKITIWDNCELKLF